jgi:HD-like signal output (HDOD) protein
MAAAPTATSTAPPARPVRSFGRFELRKLLGKSTLSMVWLVHDPQLGHELILALPRVQPDDKESRERWHLAVRKAARLNHPHLAHALEVGEHEHWPYAAYDRANGITLAERLTSQGEPAAEVARWSLQALEGLAFAHEAGAVHGDLQTHMLLISDHGHVRVMGLEVAFYTPSASRTQRAAPSARGVSVDLEQLRRQRNRAELDVLSLGVVLHHLLAAQPALDEPDVGAVIERLPPLGRDIVRLPWTIPRPVPEALRAIVNRSTERQERQRYRNARSLARALSGWLEAESHQGGDPHALLLDRVGQIGTLPATPGGNARAARLATLERERTNELADIVLRDLALAFELLRLVNTAQVRGSQVSGNGPVLTVRRAIAMIGIDGVRRASLALRPWPGPLSEPAAADLAALIERTKRAGRIAQALRPAGYDAEVIYLVTLLQNLGRLLVQYHCPDEAQQIQRLMQPLAASRPGESDEPGMSEEAAAFAVLGSDTESMGAAVARHWGMDDAVLHMLRRLPLQAPVRTPSSDDEMLRTTASAANEAMDALAQPDKLRQPALERVAARYARVLGVSARDLQAVVQGAERPAPPAPGFDADEDAAQLPELVGTPGDAVEPS